MPTTECFLNAAACVEVPIPLRWKLEQKKIKKREDETDRQTDRPTDTQKIKSSTGNLNEQGIN